MGTIANDVKMVFLQQYSDQKDMLKPFLYGFDVTYAEKKTLNNTVLFAYLLKPEQYLSDAFGIDKEILLAYSPYDKIQPRALQATNMLFDVFPFKNRVDTLNCFIVSKDSEVLDLAGITSFSEAESRSMVPFIYSELVANAGDVLEKLNMLSAIGFETKEDFVAQITAIVDSLLPLPEQTEE